MLVDVDVLLFKLLCYVTSAACWIWVVIPFLWLKSHKNSKIIPTYSPFTSSPHHTHYTLHYTLLYVEIDHVMQAGKKNRSTGATAMNMTSSRSHSIFTIVVECGESDAR